MPDVTKILEAIDSGDAKAAGELLPLVYEELRRLAASRMANESADHTLEPTALVHEAYIRLVGKGEQGEPGWQNRGHFFAAAAEAMRRILVDYARRKRTAKRGGGRQRELMDERTISAPVAADELLALDEALDQLSEVDERVAELIKLRFFAGLTNQQAAQFLGVSPRTANQLWSYGRAWLFDRLLRD